MKIITFGDCNRKEMINCNCSIIVLSLVNKMNKTRLTVYILSCTFLTILFFCSFSESIAGAQEGKGGLVLTYAPGSYNSDIVPGENETIFLELINSSNSNITNISFSFDTPRGWAVTANPQFIDDLNVGGSLTIEVNVTAPKYTERGNYSITTIADSDAGRTALSIYLRVEKGTNIWLWIGIGIALIMIVLFVVIYRRYSRD